MWNGKQADATALVHKFEKQVDGLKECKRKLNEAFIYQQAVSREDYEQMRAALADELAACELSLSQARADEIEVDEVLNFAETLLLNAAEVWQRCSLDQKQRLQQVLFPQGVEYSDGIYRTQETSFLFKGLTDSKSNESGLVAQTILNWNQLWQWLTRMECLAGELLSCTVFRIADREDNRGEERSWGKVV